MVPEIITGWGKNQMQRLLRLGNSLGGKDQDWANWSRFRTWAPKMLPLSSKTYRFISPHFPAPQLNRSIKVQLPFWQSCFFYKFIRLLCCLLPIKINTTLQYNWQSYQSNALSSTCISFIMLLFTACMPNHFMWLATILGENFIR